MAVTGDTLQMRGNIVINFTKYRMLQNTKCYRGLTVQSTKCYKVVNVKS